MPKSMLQIVSDGNNTSNLDWDKCKFDLFYSLDEYNELVVMNTNLAKVNIDLIAMNNIPLEQLRVKLKDAVYNFMSLNGYGKDDIILAQKDMVDVVIDDFMK